MTPLWQEFRNAEKIEIWVAGNGGAIAAISVDGVVRRFAPLRFLREQRVQQVRSRGPAIQTDQRHRQAVGWMKTRWGYVTQAKGAYFEEMQKRYLGEWDTQR
jgi:hypothetical protein